MYMYGSGKSFSNKVLKQTKPSFLFRTATVTANYDSNKVSIYQTRGRPKFSWSCWCIRRTSMTVYNIYNPQLPSVCKQSGAQFALNSCGNNVGCIQNGTYIRKKISIFCVLNSLTQDCGAGAWITVSFILGEVMAGHTHHGWCKAVGLRPRDPTSICQAMHATQQPIPMLPQVVRRAIRVKKFFSTEDEKSSVLLIFLCKYAPIARGWIDPK